jgi:hypothetical protein
MADDNGYETLFKDPEHAALFRAFKSAQQEIERRLGRLDVKVYGVIAGLVAAIVFVVTKGVH